MIDSYISVEQEKREKQEEFVAIEQQADSNAAMYLNPKISGKFENKIDEEIIRNSFAYYLHKASNDRYTID
ncbi:hypothetical protein IQ255_30900 [Pleurocapsales cyanobacterium LEGE 10410]|nr:hypothetical protein [Pleurocapsales cyanobacterium LEGE 10410]